MFDLGEVAVFKEKGGFFEVGVSLKFHFERLHDPPVDIYIN